MIELMAFLKIYLEQQFLTNCFVKKNIMLPSIPNMMHRQKLLFQLFTKSLIKRPQIHMQINLPQFQINPLLLNVLMYSHKNNN